MADLTTFLAQVIGVYLLIAGIAGLLYPGRMKKAMGEFAQSKILPYFDGVIALLVGLLIVLSHNMWEGLTATIVTVVGWLAVLEGLAMFLLPQDMVKRLTDKLESMGRMLGVVAVVAGAYLVYVGFIA